MFALKDMRDVVEAVNLNKKEGRRMMAIRLEALGSNLKLRNNIAQLHRALTQKPYAHPSPIN